MKYLFSTLAAVSLAAILPPAAIAAPWMSINQRQVTLSARIDQGVRSGALTRPEAVRLRSDFAALARLEGQYRRSGNILTLRERADLDRRFDALSRRVYGQKHDRQVR